VEKREYPHGAGGGEHVKIGHAAPEQRVSVSEVVVNVPTAHHRGDPPARLVDAQPLGHGVAQRLDTLA